MLRSGYAAFAFLILLEILSSRIANAISYVKLEKIYRKVLYTRKAEKSGELYQEVFRVKLWKDYVPAFGTFDKKHLNIKVSGEYLSCYLLESVRAEVVHYLCLIFTFLFLLIASPAAERFLWIFFSFINFPCIIIQRYNRPRFERILSARHETLIIPPEDADYLRSPRRR